MPAMKKMIICAVNSLKHHKEIVRQYWVLRNPGETPPPMKTITLMETVQATRRTE
jgi:hypothetical protein